MNVVIRYFDVLQCWSICHANSYQNAFGSKVNTFDTRDEAVKFLSHTDHVLEFYAEDPLQAFEQA